MKNLFKAALLLALCVTVGLAFDVTISATPSTVHRNLDGDSGEVREDS